MPTFNKPLTQRLIDTTPLPSEGFKELRERGLTVRIYATGKRSFSYEYRSPLTKKPTRVGLAVSTLADARTAVLKHKLTLGEHRDPNAEQKAAVTARRIELARAKDVSTAVEIYAADFVTRSAKQVSRRERLAKLRRAVEPFNSYPVASLTKGELIGRLDVIEKESGPVARNHAQAEMRAWLGWLHERELVETVALAGVKKRGVEKARTRVLTNDELGAVSRATTDGSAFSDIVRVALHTGMRRGEISQLQPRDLDFEARTIKVRPEVGKTGERVIPMIDAIAPLLAARAEGLNHRPDAYIFGEASGFRKPFSGWGKSVDRVRGEGDWTLHDLRRTVATRLYEAGVDSLVVEDLLGHTTGVRGGIRGVYNRAITIAKQRDALNDWSAKLASLMGENVTPLRFGRR